MLTSPASTQLIVLKSPKVQPALSTKKFRLFKIKDIDKVSTEDLMNHMKEISNIPEGWKTNGTGTIFHLINKDRYLLDELSRKFNSSSACKASVFFDKETTEATLRLAVVDKTKLMCIDDIHTLMFSATLS